MGPKERKRVSGVCQQGDGSWGMTEINFVRWIWKRLLRVFWCWASVDYIKDFVFIQRKGLNNFKLWTKLFIWCLKSITLPAEWRIDWIGPRAEEGEVNKCHCAYSGDWRSDKCFRDSILQLGDELGKRSGKGIVKDNFLEHFGWMTNHSLNLEKLQNKFGLIFLELVRNVKHLSAFLH